ncbi:ATP-dependent Clp protease proteolytic subunit [Acetivibrio cellulolyticus]|uniref:ATP-dependent Clp protease proteolytic subunit n=1 Tax=Acetivibrio cellulolyticus TaxID=35830 RepID=UPI0001E2C221|nr:ATP-dependent Clp protease proteolytic subunit [Acetivibrio cellulolyticus]
MAAFLLSSGTKGKRIALENSKIVMAPLSGKNTSDLSDAQKKSIETVINKMNEIWLKNTGQDIARIINDSENLRVFNQHEARDYGIIDRIGFDS